MVAVREQLPLALARLEAGGARFVRPLEQVARAPYFYLSYHDEDNRALHERIAAFFRRTVPATGFVAPHCASPGRFGLGRRLKVGVCSSYLRWHTIGFLNRGLVAHLPRDEVEVIVIRPDGASDPIADQIGRRCDRLLTLPGGLPRTLRMLAGLELDVLFYPDVGMDLLSYLLAHCRLAPVQCVTWGHPDTTGLDSLDYFLSSVDLESGPEADALYTERLIQLGNLPTCFYRPPAPSGAPPTRAEFGLPEAATLYVSPHTPWKFVPDFDPLLAAILGRDPDARLVLVTGPKGGENARRLVQRLGESMPADRILLLPRVPNERFSAFLSLADVVLDTRPFGAGRLAYECMALGVPIVTWPGDFMRGRVVNGLYRQMELGDCVAADAAGYVDTAVRLATDRTWRDAVVTRIRERAPAVFGQVGAARELAAFFRQAVDDARQGGVTERWQPWRGASPQ